MRCICVSKKRRRTCWYSTLADSFLSPVSCQVSTAKLKSVSAEKIAEAKLFTR